MYDLSALRAQLRDSRSPLWALEGEMIRCLMEKWKRLEDRAWLSLWRGELALLYGDVDALLEGESAPLWERYCLPPERPSRLFQCVQTFYSLLVKRIALRVLGGTGEFEDILSGRAFQAAGVWNYGGGDWFSWPLEVWDGALEGLCRRLEALLEEVDTVPEAEFTLSPDDLPLLYESAIPQTLRRALGEFHTPGWLADCALECALRAAGRPAEELSFLDPTCGSGGFLVCALAAVRRGGKPEEQVWGMDINPLAVLTAKTAYLAALGERPAGGLVPVYHSDVLHPPEERGDRLVLDTGCGLVCALPLDLCRRAGAFPGQAERFLELLRGEDDPDCARLRERLAGWDSHTRRVVSNLLLERIAAHLRPRADVAVGNPPWVNWENLPELYREKSKHLWPEYGLFEARGPSRSFSKEDISTLITCVVLRRLLREGGYLSFVLRQGMFKSARNGAMFRQFRIPQGEVPFRVLRVDDLSDTNPFPGLGTRSALVLIRRDEAHTFPVPYRVWRRKRGFWKAARSPRAAAEQVLALVERQELAAFPSVDGEPASPWVTASLDLAPALERLLGSNPYRARTGVFTGGANGVYWLDRLEPGPEGTVRADNGPARARRKVRQVRAELERGYLYPLVQGSGLEKWRVSSSRYILFPHDRDSRIRPVEEGVLAASAPKTWAYLQSFRTELEARRGFAGWERKLHADYFYMLLRVGAYTFAPYKVAWRYIARSFLTAVVSSVRDPVLGERLYLPNEKVMYVGLEDEGEAFYLCGVLSSAPVRFCVQCYMDPISISAHVLDKLNIPPYRPDDPLHRELSDLCRAGHQTGDQEALRAIQSCLDRAAGALYGIPEAQVRAMGEETRDMRRNHP